MSVLGLSRPVAAPGTLRVLAALLSYPDADVRRHLPEMLEILRRERALPGGRLAELDLLMAKLRRPIRSTPRPSTCSCSTAAAARRCTCSSTCTAIRATAARR